MIFESVAIVILAIALDFTLGDPKNRFHPTVWVGKLIAFLVPLSRSNSPITEKFGGTILTVTVCAMVIAVLVFVQVGLDQISFEIFGLVFSVMVAAVLLKTTIAIRGLENHAIKVLDSIEQNDLDSARNNLALIVKRDTKNLDKNHILSGVLESVSENTVDGVTGPLFYFGFLGLPGAFLYRAVNTMDSMIGYKNRLFQNVGWFSANCDKFLNFIPSRITGFLIIFSSMILGYNWKLSYSIMLRDSSKLSSPNAGFPMAALAGALSTKLEKINHYEIGDGTLELTREHIKSAVSLMKVTAILFCTVVVIPTVILLSYLGWWPHA